MANNSLPAMDAKTFEIVTADNAKGATYSDGLHAKAIISGQ
jgi:hypothetical protein